MGRIGWVEGVGYLASLLVFCTFYMKTMLPLRCVAITSNLAFMAYGLTGGLYPVFFLHMVLLPLNCLRLYQLDRLIRKVRRAAHGDLSVESLIPLMTRQRFAKGDTIFRTGEVAQSMCLLLSGSIRLVELGVVLGPSSLVGEMGLFTPDNRRTGTAVCETDVEIGSITDEKALLLYYQNPAFGLSLFKLVVRRMLENEQRWRGAISG